MATILHEILNRGDFSPVTRDKYRRIIDAWIRFASDDPHTWTRLQAQAFYDSLLTSVSVETANVYIASLRYVSRWYATQTGFEDFAIVQTRASASVEVEDDATPARALSPEEATALLAACSPTELTGLDRRDRTLVLVGLETGMRRKSLEGLRIEMLDKQREYPIVRVPIKGRSGNKTFKVPLSNTAAAVISDWRMWLRKRGITSGGLFPTFGHDKRPTEKGISASTIYQIITKRAAIARVPDMHPHILRHTFITWRREAGLSPISIASITGHKTFGDEWRNIQPYLDMGFIAKEARNSTPPWLMQIVQSWGISIKGG